MVDCATVKKSDPAPPAAGLPEEDGFAGRRAEADRPKHLPEEDGFAVREAEADRPKHLIDRRLLVQTGKGGVGKSSVTAALALLALRRGKRVLVCEVNGDDRIPALLGLPAVGTRLVEVRPRLFCVNVRPHEAMIEYGLMKLHSSALVGAVLENRVMRYFLQALPSLAEVVTTGKILFHVREREKNGRPRFDLVLVDAPATGHGLALLQVPRTVMGTVPPGPLKEDLRWMAELLEDPRETAINVVALPEELPIQETVELDVALRKAGLPRGVCFLNGVWPSRFAEGELSLLPDEPFWKPVRETARRMQVRAALCAEERARLAAGVDMPLLELPQLFGDRFAEEAVEILSRAIEAQMGPPAEAPPARAEGRP